MDALIERVRTAFPALLDEGDVSVVRVRTTQLIVMLFGPVSEHPVCVLQRGDKLELEATHEMLRAIARHDPGLVAAPYGCIEDDHGSTWGVVQGLAGWPWFALARVLAGGAGFAAVRAIAIATLARFRTAVAAEPEWRVRSSLGDKFEQCLRALAAVNPAASAAIPAPTRRRWQAALDAAGEVVWPWQHGDFCLNNLLIDDGGARVIDFEEFGLTNMPLHDEFSLAYSLQGHVGGASVGVEFERVLQDCASGVGREYATAADLRDALHGHHLCWRLVQCASRSKRAASATGLLARLSVLAREG